MVGAIGLVGYGLRRRRAAGGSVQPEPHPVQKRLSMKTILAVIGAVVLVFAVPCSAGTINFDTDANGNLINAPDDFSATTNLTTLYSPLGVTFSGSGGSNNGGAILNEASNFGVSALSGANFLAFNPNVNVTLANGGLPIDPETINFASPQSLVTLYVATGSNGTASFELEGYQSSVLVASSTATSTSGYEPLSVSFPSGMNSVVLSGGADRPFVVDNLSFQAVPEPSTLALLAAGAIGLLGYGWRRRRATKSAKPSAFDQQDAPAILSFTSHTSAASAARRAA